MKTSASMPYRKALPYLLKRNSWSYRDLDFRTHKSASYWNQTVTGKQTTPKNPDVYEMLAELFEISPEYFEEYQPLKAAALVLKDPKLAYIVLREAKSRESV